MGTFDFSPLYRSTIGFDRLPSLLDAASRVESNTPSYPPYNIELIGDDHYQITMAVAGYTLDELTVLSENQTLTVKGSKASGDKSRNYLHQGIAKRAFERRFQLADHVEVRNARLENGLLHVDLVREVPEAMKPRAIPINSGELVEAAAEPKVALKKAS